MRAGWPQLLLVCFSDGLRVAHRPLLPPCRPPRALVRLQGGAPAGGQGLAGGDGLADPVGYAVGIDLGTTTSAIAVVVDGLPQVIHTLRSVVRPAGASLESGTGPGSSTDMPCGANLPGGSLAWAAEHGELVGAVSPEAPGVLFSAKRLMGRTFDEADATLPRHSALRRLLAPLPAENSSANAGNRSADAENSSAAEKESADAENGSAAGPSTPANATGWAAGGDKARAGLRPSHRPGATSLQPVPISSPVPVWSTGSVPSVSSPVSVSSVPSRVPVPSGGPVVSPEWVSSRVLLALLDASEIATGVRARRAVIGVPAHFGAKQREATRAAAAMAGLVTVKLIVEPVAAALAYDVAEEARRKGVRYTAEGAGAGRGGVGRGAADASISGTRGAVDTGRGSAGRGAIPVGAGPAARDRRRAAPAARPTPPPGGIGDRNEVVCVYDLGGGTLDVSILSMGGGTAEVLASSGDAWLGGDDFDSAIAAALARRAGLPAAAAGEAGLVSAARAAKERLTVARAVNVSVALNVGVNAPSLQGAGASDPPPLVVELTRADMNRACSPLFARLCAPLIKAAAACQIPLREPRGGAGGGAGGGGAESGDAAPTPPRRSRADASRPSLRGRRIDRVVLVGAASRMPAVASLVQEYTGLRPDQNSVRPEDAVACGAAVQAAILQGELEAYDVFTVLEAALIRGVMSGRGSQRERRADKGGRRPRRP